MIVFYDRVKELVNKNTSFTLRAFIESLGINYDSYNGHKRYDNLPRADEAVKIAKALNTTVEYLVNGKAAECTAIHPTAKENDLDRSFTTQNVTQNNDFEKSEIDLSKYCSEFGINPEKLNAIFKKLTDENGGVFHVISQKYFDRIKAKEQIDRKVEADMAAIRRKYENEYKQIRRI